MKRKTLTTIIQLVVFAGIGAGVIWYMFSRMSIEQRNQMSDAIWHTQLWLMIPVCIVALASHWSRAKRWQLLLDPLGIRPSTPNTLFAVLIGYLINLIPPRAGEVAKCTVLARYENVPADKMIGTIVAERAWDVVCLLIVIAAGLGWQASVMDESLQQSLLLYAPKGPTLLITLAVIAGIVVALVLIYRTRPQSKLSRMIKGLGDGVTSIFHLRKRGQFLLHTLFIWAAYIFQLQLGFWSLEGTHELGLGPAVMALIFGSVALIGAPGGLGLYPLLVGLLLQKGYGLDAGDANAFGWVSWGFLTGTYLIFGFASLILLPFYNRTKHDAQAPLATEQDR